MTTTYAEGNYNTEFLMGAVESVTGTQHLDTEILISGQNLKSGSVLGEIGRGTTTVGTPVFTGTGDGTLTKATPAYSSAALNGDYSVVCVEKTTDSGLFEVLRPDGTSDGFAKVGTAYDGQIKFTIADGSTDFAQGDKWVVPVTVAAGSGKFTQIDFSATNGAQNAAGILLMNTDASAADKNTAVVKRFAEVNSAYLVWPDGATSPQKAAAVLQLEARGIIVR
jgi:hypothetical protein